MPAVPRAFRFGTEPWDPSHRFETSWLLPPYVLGAMRAFISLYAFTTLIFIIAYTSATPSEGGSQTAGDNFSYFTTLTYWGLAFYFLASSIHTLSYARCVSRSSKASPSSSTTTSSSSGAAATPTLSRLPRPLQALHALLQTTATTFPLLVTIVYWALIFGPSWFPSAYAAWSNVSQHALNTAFALLELGLARTAPPPAVHLLWLVVLLALYLGLAYVTRATKGFYTYTFLDPGLQGPLVAAYVFGIAVAIIVLFGLVWALAWARLRLTEGKAAAAAAAALRRRGNDGRAPARLDDVHAIDMEKRAASGAAGQEKEHQDDDDEYDDDAKASGKGFAGSGGVEEVLEMPSGVGVAK